MIDERLIRDIEVGAIARPRYSTDVIKTDSGYEVRNQRWSYPLFQFEFALEPGDREDEDQIGLSADQKLSAFVNLWHAAAGQFNTLRFRDWGDWDVTNQEIATGDGTTKTFQLYRVYKAGNVTRTRKITRPVTGSVTAYLDGVETAVTVDYDTGQITFAAAPTNGAAITADFQFDIPVRFADDQLELVAIMKSLDKPTNIMLIEVRE